MIDLAHEWHPTKNGNTSYEEAPIYGKKLPKVWWLGECGHEWEAKKEARVVKGTGCPYCTNRKVLTGFNDIATVHPEWLKFWSPSNTQVASEVLSGGRAEYAWLCELGHEFWATVGQRERGRGCPYCSNHKLLVGFNDLASKYPDIAREWHPTKNKMSADEVIAGGRQKYWWLGECGHEWETHIRRRIEGAGCHVCAGHKVVAGTNDLASQYPDIAREWHPTRNESLIPDTIMCRSTVRVWWVCNKGHEWEARVLDRTVYNNGCNVCKAEVSKRGVKEQNLSVTNPELISEWHPTKNGDLKPTLITKGSHLKVWWLGKCGHEWETVVYARGLQGSGCPVCAGLAVVPGFNDLATTHLHLSKELHLQKNKYIDSQNIVSGSNKSVWWLCPKNHSYKMKISKRTLAGQNCPICSGHRVVAGINDLATLEPDIAAEWHPTKNSPVLPRMVPGKGGRVSAWWRCKKGHEWEAKVKSRIRGRGCPQCWALSYISKAEHAIHGFIVSIIPEETVIQSDKKLLNGQELDLYIPSKKLAIEFNGLYWHTERTGKHRTYHHDKWLKCKEKGVQLIQIWEDDWNRNPEQVKRMLAHKLGVSQERKVFARKTSVVEVNKANAEQFLNENHIQGYGSGSYYLGLRDNEKDELVALLVLKNEPGTDGKTLNIIRYATSCNVVGGFTKLLKHAERTYMPEDFITFADHCVSDGGLYEKSGFIADKILPPDYMYVVGLERKHKFGYRLKKFRDDPNLIWEEGLTERELAALNGLERIWDAGKTRYRYIV